VVWFGSQLSAIVNSNRGSVIWPLLQGRQGMALSFKALIGMQSYISKVDRSIRSILQFSCLSSLGAPGVMLVGCNASVLHNMRVHQAGLQKIH